MEKKIEEPKLSEVLHIYGENVQVSDGFHTFQELYEHRNRLFIALCHTEVEKFGSHDFAFDDSEHCQDRGKGLA